MNSKTALVTGATSGIGRELVLLLAKKNFKVIISGRNANELTRLQNEVEVSLVQEVIQADLSKIDEREKLCQAIRTYTPDLIFNNAGYGMYGHATDHPFEKHRDLIEVNICAVVELTLEGIQAFLKQKKKGTIVNISSAASFFPGPMYATYAASKAFINEFSTSLDYENKHQGIRVLTSCPGMVETNFSKRAGGITNEEAKFAVLSPKEVADSIWDQVGEAQPLKIINWRYRLMYYLSKLFTKNWQANFIMKNMKNRVSK